MLGPAAVVAAALLVSVGVLAGAGADPLAALAALGGGAFGDRFALVDTLVKSCPLALTGLAVAIAFRSGVWNIGAEGQLLAGALAATAAAHAAAERPLALAAALASAVAAGALWAGLAAALKLRRQVNEVIATIMLNFIAARLVGFAVHGPLMETAGHYPQSDVLPAAAHLPTLGGGLHGGIALALGAVPLVWLVLHRTALGFRWRAAGDNYYATHLAGLAPARATMSAMLVSGGLAGLAGGIEVTGVTHRLFEQFSGGQGYTAIAVALLARLHPGWVAVSALFFGALTAGAGAMQRSAGVSAVFASIVQATVILALLAAEAPRFAHRRGRRRDDLAPRAGTAA